MKSILFIHQSAELYGSDKTMLMFLANIDRSRYFPVIVLPFDGPLKEELEKVGITVRIAPVLKLYRKMFTPRNLMRFVSEYRQGMRELEKLHEEYNFKLVYSHTLAALIGLLFARSKNIKHLWHVQEILAKPRLINKTFKRLLAMDTNNKIIYDSIATMNFWIEGQPELLKKSDFVWNGLDPRDKVDYPAEEVQNVREQIFGAVESEVVIGLVGRINSWKGQQLLLKAFHILRKDHVNIKLVFIGSAPPNQSFFESDLRNEINRLKLDEHVVIIPFQREIWKYWQSLDIAVVPSTEPEPFGMVAIEAMLAQKPVVAANHGGLAEIVLNGETGYLFEPGNEVALASCLEALLFNSSDRSRFGTAGHNRATTQFSLKSHVDKIEKIFVELDI